MSVDAAQTQVIGSLRTQLTQAFAHVASLWMDADLKRQHMGALEAEGVRINDLDGRLRTAVRDGQWSASKWFEVARLCADGIDATAGFAGGARASVSRIWAEVVQPTGSTVVAGVERAAEVVESQLPFYVIAAVIGLIALAVIRVGRPA